MFEIISNSFSLFGTHYRLNTVLSKTGNFATVVSQPYNLNI